MDNTNFSIQGGACPPPHNSELFLGRGVNIEYTDKGRVEVSKEWVKDLLSEFSMPLIITDEMYDNGGWLQYIDEFLEKSEVWNGK